MDTKRDVKMSEDITDDVEKAEAVEISSRSDVAQGLYEDSLLMEPDERDRVARRVLLKLDFCVLPIMCFIYFLSFLDKSTLNYSNAYGLSKGLHLHGRDYSWIAAMANFGYLVGAYPMALGLQIFPIGRFIGIMVTVWGILLCCTTVTHNAGGMMALRFLLGVFEAGIGPAWVALTTMFWTSSESTLRMSFWLGINGIATMAGAGISWGLGHTHNAGLEPWQLVFLVVGVISVASGLVGFFVIPSSPDSNIFFNHREACVAVWRVRNNNIGIKNSHMKWSQIVEGAKDPKLYLFLLCGLAVGMQNGAVANFLTTLFKSFGYSDLQSVLYQLPGGAFQFVFTILGGLFATKIPNTLIITTCIAYLPGLGGVLGICLTPLSHQLRLAASAWIIPTTGLAVILTWNIVGANTAGYTKRTLANGVQFTAYAAGNIISPFFYLPNEKPRSPTAIKALIGIYLAGIFFTATLGLYMWRHNKQRRKLAIAETAAQEGGFADLTDMENKGFIYKL